MLGGVLWACWVGVESDAAGPLRLGPRWGYFLGFFFSSFIGGFFAIKITSFESGYSSVKSDSIHSAWCGGIIVCVRWWWRLVVQQHVQCVRLKHHAASGSEIIGMAFRIGPTVPPAIDRAGHGSTGFVEQVRTDCEHDVPLALANQVHELHAVTIGVVRVLDARGVAAHRARYPLDVALAIHDVEFLSRAVGFLEVKDTECAAFFKSFDEEIGGRGWVDRADHRDTTMAQMQGAMSAARVRSRMGRGIIHHLHIFGRRL